MNFSDFFWIFGIWLFTLNIDFYQSDGSRCLFDLSINGYGVLGGLELLFFRIQNFQFLPLFSAL